MPTYRYMPEEHAKIGEYACIHESWLQSDTSQRS